VSESADRKCLQIELAVSAVGDVRPVLDCFDRCLRGFEARPRRFDRTGDASWPDAILLPADDLRLVGLNPLSVACCQPLGKRICSCDGRWSGSLWRPHCLPFGGVQRDTRGLSCFGGRSDRRCSQTIGAQVFPGSVIRIARSSYRRRPHGCCKCNSGCFSGQGVADAQRSAKSWIIRRLLVASAQSARST
jgi:hypothetical protein